MKAQTFPDPDADGFYWVRNDNEWTVGHWDTGYRMWWLVGSDEAWPSQMIDDIGPALKPPASEEL